MLGLRMHLKRVPISSLAPSCNLHLYPSTHKSCITRIAASLSRTLHNCKSATTQYRRMHWRELCIATNNFLPITVYTDAHAGVHGKVTLHSRTITATEGRFVAYHMVWRYVSGFTLVMLYLTWLLHCNSGEQSGLVALSHWLVTAGTKSTPQTAQHCYHWCTVRLGVSFQWWANTAQCQCQYIRTRGWQMTEHEVEEGHACTHKVQAPSICCWQIENFTNGELP